MFNILNLFFPPYCINCNTIMPVNSKKWICPDCLDVLSFIKDTVCSKCGTVLKDMTECSRCKTTTFLFEKNFSAFEYNQAIRRIVHNLKFYYRRDTADTLGRLMYEYLTNRLDFKQLDLIVPVPMHRKKKWKRGYNQAECLARKISKCMDLEMNADSLIKVTETKVQSLVPTELRALNVAGSYDVIMPEKFVNKKILLIDDVFTTGNTINECCKIMIDSGALSVTTATLAITI